MDDRDTMRAEHDEALKRLLALGLSVCERIEARLAAADTDEALQARTLAFTRAARSVRQTIALRERLLREAERADRQSDEAARASRVQAVAARRARVRLTLEREVEDAADEDDDSILTMHALDQMLIADMLDDDFATRPLEPYLADLRKELGLPDPESADASVPNAPQAELAADTS